jgi:hypothetical protein
MSALLSCELSKRSCVYDLPRQPSPKKYMGNFKAGEIVAKDLSPCGATPTVAISDPGREIGQLRSKAGESKTMTM